MKTNLSIYDQLQAHVQSGIRHTSYYDGKAYTRRDPAPPLVCQDGFKMSVQARDGAYCTPRNDTGPYSEFELWCLTHHEECLSPWGDGEDPYAYVPVNVVEYIIRKHGGFKVEEPVPPPAPALPEIATFTGVVKAWEQEGGYCAPDIELISPDGNGNIRLCEEIAKYDGRHVVITVTVEN